METLIDPAPVKTPEPLAVTLGPLRLANPVMPASGCFGPGTWSSNDN